MDFISNRQPQITAMLDAIGAKSIEELFSAVPASILQAAPTEDDGLSEYEGLRLMEQLAASNTGTALESYVGAGCYDHHVPALVSAITQKSEFLTSYTPYQAEASQGTLTTIFEFQTLICALTGMPVSNASLYDGASACAEAVLMALRAKKDRKKVLIAGNIHPDYLAVVRQYMPAQYSIEALPFDASGATDKRAYKSCLDEDVACVLFAYSNFFGVIEDLPSLIASAKEVGALFVLSANPLLFGAYESAAGLGVDIAVGDMQPLGMHLQMGGPSCGYIACQSDLMRQMPGRIVGKTVDSDGKPGYVLTLQAREQHIRREKATSNICTAKALCGLMSLVASVWYGPKGLKELATTNFQRTAYLKKHLQQLSGVAAISEQPHFNEFVIELKKPVPQVLAAFRAQGIDAGLDLENLWKKRNLPQASLLKHTLLVCVTETKSKEQLDRYLAVAKQILA